MNARKLERNLMTERAKEKFLDWRIRRQVARTLSFLSGCISQFRRTPTQIFKLEELDDAGIMMPMDQVERFGQYCRSRGQTPLVTVPYHKACVEGWAPAPTNEFQKAVWDKVHSIPDKPLKIQFDPAAQKGKVTK